MNFKLDLFTHDLIIEDFTFSKVETEQEEITQRLKIKLLMFKEEWFLDRNYGIPYKQEIMVKGIDLDDIDDIFRLAISQEDGVDELVKYKSTWNSSTRDFIINCTIRTTNGNLVSIFFPV